MPGICDRPLRYLGEMFGMVEKDRRTFAVMLGAVFLAALVVRLWWVFEVQPPGEAVFSDMRGYIQRALWLLRGEQDISVERQFTMALYPFGTHWFLAALLRLPGSVDPEVLAGTRLGLVGCDLSALGVVQALLNAAVVPFAMLAARRMFRGLAGPLVVGVLLAFWHPLLVFSGYFLSETPFTFCLALSFWLWLRYFQTGRGHWAAGLAVAVGFTFRPQLLLTALLGLLWLACRHGRIPSFRWRHLAWLALPIALTVTLSAARYRHFTGEWGLISGNAAIGRFFAATEYAGIRGGKGHRFTPPARTPENGFAGAYVVPGFISEAAPLDEERERVWSAKTTMEKAFTLQRNIAFLAHRNLLWPERNAAHYAERHRATMKRLGLATEVPEEGEDRNPEEETDEEDGAGPDEPGWRQQLVGLDEAVVLYGLIPLALLGLAFVAWRRHPGLELAALHLGTMAFSAAAYFGEVRYRVPYDVFLVLAAVYSVLALARLEPSPGPQGRLPRLLAAVGIFAVVLLIGLSVAAWYRSDDARLGRATGRLEDADGAELRRALRDPSPWTRGAAIRVVAGRAADEEGLVEALMPLLADQWKPNRQAVRQALVEIGEPAVGPLIEMLGRDSPLGGLTYPVGEGVHGIRTSAKDALGALGSVALPALARTLEESNDALARRNTVGALGRMKGEAEAVVPLLLEANAADEDGGVRANALADLGRLAPLDPRVEAAARRSATSVDRRLRRIATDVLERVAGARRNAGRR